MKRQPVALTVLSWITLALVAAAAVLVFWYAPMEVNMGAVQKIFYFHVAASWIGMLGFTAAAVCGVMYLRTKDLKWDVYEVAGVEIGMVFMLIGIVTGSIWAYPTWNTWWTWDPRLTTVTIMELIYAAYLLLRQGIDEPEKRARFGAIYAIVGFLSVPLTFFSIRIFRTIHPVVIGSNDPSAEGSFDMSPKMLTTFMFSLAAFTVMFVTVYWHRIRLGLLAQRVEHLKIKMME